MPARVDCASVPNCGNHSAVQRRNVQQSHHLSPSTETAIRLSLISAAVSAGVADHCSTDGTRHTDRPLQPGQPGTDAEACRPGHGRTALSINGVLLCRGRVSGCEPSAFGGLSSGLDQPNSTAAIVNDQTPYARIADQDVAAPAENKIGNTKCLRPTDKIVSVVEGLETTAKYSALPPIFIVVSGASETS